LAEAEDSIQLLAIIEHPMSTLVVPTQNYVHLDEHRFIGYHRK